MASIISRALLDSGRCVLAAAAAVMTFLLELCDVDLS
jgi:hypothetical protein